MRYSRPDEAARIGGQLHGSAPSGATENQWSALQLCALSQISDGGIDRLSGSIDRLSDTPEWRNPREYIARMKTRTQWKSQAGFTLYELMVTVTIVGVILSFGLANMGDLNRNGRMVSTANDLHAAFHIARSEAARAKGNITICASANAMDPAPACGGTWDQGYIVFADTDGNIAVDVGEAILRRHDVVEEGVSLNFANGATYFGYSATGLGRGNVGGNPAVSQVVICDDRGNMPHQGSDSTARLFVVTPMGRGTILRDHAQIQTAYDNMGAVCP